MFSHPFIYFLMDVHVFSYFLCLTNLGWPSMLLSKCYMNINYFKVRYETHKNSLLHTGHPEEM